MRGLCDVCLRAHGLLTDLLILRWEADDGCWRDTISAEFCQVLRAFVIVTVDREVATAANAGTGTDGDVACIRFIMMGSNSARFP